MEHHAESAAASVVARWQRFSLLGTRNRMWNWYRNKLQGTEGCIGGGGWRDVARRRIGDAIDWFSAQSKITVGCIAWSVDASEPADPQGTFKRSNAFINIPLSLDSL